MQRMMQSIQKQSSCEISVRPQNARVKKMCEIKGGSQEMAVIIRSSMAKILITTIQVNLCVLLQVMASFVFFYSSFFFTIGVMHYYDIDAACKI